MIEICAIFAIVPEIDPASASSALALLIGTTLVLRDRYLSSHKS
ncbi:hypothetical protein Pr1d_33120 [Bythopirellula goksoeyrii]|uniref:Uncharacterized protein n=1 Tax=Bythopirellula goksoeyrii TaxID=1400387 RepID=A0A5B9QPV5_9BACT|nr:hypothetical protein Pr1d_33120 [Bythopirellula goksoeyrii]